MTTPIQAVIFDVGGTLLHYHDPQTDDHQRHFRRITAQGFADLLDALRVRGIDLPPNETLLKELDRQIRESYLTDLKELRGGSIETPMRAALVAQNIAVSEQQWRAVRDVFFDRIDEIVFPREGVKQTLADLQEAGYRLGLISNTYWSAHMHDRHLQDHGLLEHLPVRIYSSEAPYLKPHPGIFKMALVALGVPAGEAVYVGDRLDVDVQGAQAVGMKGVLIDSPYRLEEIDGPPPEDVTPDAVIGELPELPAALKGLEG